MRETHCTTPKASARRRGSHGFTLAELLCVIGVISVLVGLLIPTLGRARRASTAVSCMSNLRQWAAATQMYALDHHGYLPRRGQGVQPTSQVTRLADWFNALPPVYRWPAYADLVVAGTISRPGGTATVWLCPEANDFPGTYYWSYGMNMALSVEQAGINNGMPDKITGVGDTSTMVLFADAPGNYCSIFPSRTPNGYNPVARHDKRTNLCFLDGHVSAYAAAEIGIGTGLVDRSDVRWRPPGSTWNSAQ